MFNDTLETNHKKWSCPTLCKILEFPAGNAENITRDQLKKKLYGRLTWQRWQESDIHTDVYEVRSEIWIHSLV